MVNEEASVPVGVGGARCCRRVVVVSGAVAAIARVVQDLPKHRNHSQALVLALRRHPSSMLTVGIIIWGLTSPIDWVGGSYLARPCAPLLSRCLLAPVLCHVPQVANCLVTSTTTMARSASLSA